MGGRTPPTGDTRGAQGSGRVGFVTSHITHICARAAADRLAELDTEVKQLRAESAELVAELFTPPESAVRYGDTIYVDQPSATMAALNDLYQKARDDKRGLDALTLIAARDAVEMNAIIDALRPDCPTCGGTKSVTPPLWGHDAIGHGPPPHCPDCLDGKVSIAQLAATWQAVWDDPMGIKPEGHMKCEPCALCVLEHLRSVKAVGR